MGLRTPTPFATLYKWHRQALKGLNPPVFEDEPECGWYAFQHRKNGPLVPVEIRVERDIDTATGELMDDEKIVATLEGERIDPARVWLWASKRPLTKAAFNELVDLRTRADAMKATHVGLDLSQSPIRPST